jgi:hypothetical protein
LAHFQVGESAATLETFHNITEENTLEEFFSSSFVVLGIKLRTLCTLSVNSPPSPQGNSVVIVFQHTMSMACHTKSRSGSMLTMDQY